MHLLRGVHCGFGLSLFLARRFDGVVVFSVLFYSPDGTFCFEEDDIRMLSFYDYDG
jgi:hypothetical protein